MNDNLEELFEKHEDELLKFDRIPESQRLHVSDDLCGLIKIASLLKEPAKFDFSAGHDIVYLSNPCDLKELAEDDVIYLLRCGIHFDSEVECLASHC